MTPGYLKWGEKVVIFVWPNSNVLQDQGGQFLSHISRALQIYHPYCERPTIVLFEISHGEVSSDAITMITLFYYYYYH